MEEYKSFCNSDPKRIAAAKHRIILTLPDLLPIYSAQFCAGAGQRKPGHKKAAQMNNAVVSEHTVGECASPIRLVPKTDGSFYFCIEHI